ncbi:MAG: hypothetical protein EOS56_18500 [Mesorhizobium sp.]|nr:MAG: hypothetical protein EOS56_18500 [Mesorhizobium sp.]RWC66631.1 MAG: hypothetical protein EOS29_03855 [Mesorhizobium sp.]
MDGANAAFPSALRIYQDYALGLLSVEHDGSINWDTLQAIKDLTWGPEAVAIEVYPPADRVVNNVHMRHLWLLGPTDWWPDLGREGAADLSSLRDRYTVVSAAVPGGVNGRL